MRGYTITEVLILIMILASLILPFVVIGLLVSNCDSIAQGVGEAAGEVKKGYEKTSK
jgi:competence protein ComGC